MCFHGNPALLTTVILSLVIIGTESQPSILWRLYGRGRACGKPGFQCWSFVGVECYNPAVGEICSGGRVDCGNGFRRCRNASGQNCVKIGQCCKNEKQCGSECYNPNYGESCTSSGDACRFGLRACGKLCFNPKTQKCFSAKLVCNSDDESCFGIRCYKPLKGQKCYKGGQVCNRGELPGPGNTCMIQTLF